LALEVELRIDRLAKTGEGVGSFEGQSIFVPNVVPGERVQVRLLESGWPRQGELLAVLLPSPDRRTPPCPLSEVCGGCGWLHLIESAQRAAKLEIVLSSLEHLGGVRRSEIQVMPTMGSIRQLGYRRRAVMHFSGGKLAFFSRRSRRAVPIETCPALVDPISKLPGLLSPFLAAFGNDIDEVHLLAEGNQCAFAVFLRAQVRPSHLRGCEQAVTTLGLSGAVVVPREGAPVTIREPVLRARPSPDLGVPIYLRPDAFAQNNAEANEDLVRSAIQALAAGPGERILELYCGNGNFTFAICKSAGAVTSVEHSPVALELARRSAQEGRVTNVRFVQGEVGRVCDGLVAERTRFDRILADPPRMGASRIARWADCLKVRSVVYVACDPGALARDAGRLRAAGFSPQTLQLVDLFPQTPHVEAVMSFSR